MMLAKVVPPRKVIVPHFSCTVLQGDVWHPGTGDEDIADIEKVKWKRSSLYRMHLYVGGLNMAIRKRENRTS